VKRIKKLLKKTSYLTPLRKSKKIHLLIDLFRIYQLKRKFDIPSSDNSFAGELEYLKKITSELEISSGSVVDIAASNGVDQSSTLAFYRNGFSGLAIEMNPEKFSALSYVYKDFPSVNLARAKVTPENIILILKSYNLAENITILNLDIDSYDLDVLSSLLKGGIFPKIISLEINEKIPPGVFFKVNFNENHYWRGDHFYGCSIDAAAEIIKKFGYILVAMEFNNAFFVSSEVGLNVFQDLSPADAFKRGYQYRLERKLLFPYNANVEHWLDAEPSDTMRMISEYFNPYNGLFTLRLSI
jgi:hypothetical protein